MFFSTSQVASQLSTTQSRILAYCKAGAIECELTAGGQFRTSEKEVERLKAEGLPPLPHPLPDGSEPTPAGLRPRRAAGGNTLLAEPSGELIEAVESVVKLEHEVKAIDLKRKREEGLDWFRARDRREAKEREERERADRESAAEVEAKEKEQQWYTMWCNYALSLVPADAPAEVVLTLQPRLSQLFDQTDFRQPDALMQRWVDSVIEETFRSWRKSQQANQIIETAIRRLPISARSYCEDTPWQTQARQDARKAVDDLGDWQSIKDVERVACDAVDAITARIEHMERCENISKHFWLDLPSATRDEQAAAEEAVRAALADATIGADEKGLKQVKAEALRPFREAIQARRQREALQQEQVRDQQFRQILLTYPCLKMPFGLDPSVEESALAAARAAMNKLPLGTSKEDLEKTRDAAIAPTLRSATLIDSAMAELRPYIQLLSEKYEIDEPLATIERTLRPTVRAGLMKRLEGNEAPEVVAKLMREEIRSELHI